MTNQTTHPDQITIGVFDSGFGGLTVLRELLPLIPAARYLYLGDTARLPYGSKSRETIARYAVSSARFLLDQGADLLVIACNTATALALDDIRTAALPIPVLGVIEPGAQAAAKVTLAARESTGQTPGSQILVLATTATVQSHAYSHALARLSIHATEKACPLLVPLVEEGWIDHPVTREVARIYLSEALAEDRSINTLLLGCTHYPLLHPLLQQTLVDLGRPLTLIDSAQATAQAVAACFQQASPLRERKGALCTFYATDFTDKFERLGSRFLGQPLSGVHLIDLGG